ncbi:MAG: transposase [Deltaproteobacteria bacterium]|nr:transposase [Deltaproteobacteria bacterium]
MALRHVGQVADPFHVIRLADNSIDEVRLRTQNDTLDHRCRKDDPLWRARRLLISAHERLSERGDAKLRDLLTAAIPAARCASRGTPKRLSAASTTSTA